MYVPAHYSSKQKQPVAEDVKVYDGTEAVSLTQVIDDTEDPEADECAARAGMEVSGHLRASHCTSNIHYYCCCCCCCCLEKEKKNVLILLDV